MSTDQTESANTPMSQLDPPFDWKGIFNSALPRYRPAIIDLACNHNSNLVFSCNGDAVADFTRFYPLLVTVNWKADLFILNPPGNQRWNRSWLKNLSQSECAAVRTAFTAQDNNEDQDTIDSTVAALCLALDFCSACGEGYLIANEETLQRLILGENAPHRFLAAHVWAHIIINAPSFAVSVIYFAREHMVGCQFNKTILNRSAAESICFEFCDGRLEFRRGAVIKQYAYTRNTIELWNATCKRLNGNPFNLTDTKTESCFTATLGLGNVKYFDAGEFLESDVEFIISSLQTKSKNPEIKVPQVILCPSNFECGGVFLGPMPDKSIQLNFVKIDSLMEDMPWDGKLRIQHQIALFCIKNKMHSYIYTCFHQHLRLKEFAPEECLKAWVRAALNNEDIVDSFRNSADHVVVGGLVFTKNEFVGKKLAAFEKEEMEKQASVEASLLRQSQFDCFIYLMEDLRNKTFKIGRSKTPGKRERTLQSEVPEIVMRFSIPADDAHERELHDHFESKRLRGEWFMLTNEDLVWIVNFLKTNGDVSRAIVDTRWLGEIHLMAAPLKI